MPQNIPFALLEIRVISSGSAGKPDAELYRFLSPCVPHLGDTFQVQYWQCEVISVNWNIVNSRPLIDVVVDTLETEPPND